MDLMAFRIYAKRKTNDKRDTSVHNETYGRWTAEWNKAKTTKKKKSPSLMTYAHPFVRPMLHFVLRAKCCNAHTHTISTRMIVFGSQNVRAHPPRIFIQFNQMDTRYDMDSWFSCCNWDKCTNGQMFVTICSREIDA